MNVNKVQDIRVAVFVAIDDEVDKIHGHVFQSSSLVTLEINVYS